jgi:hypothetical protein
MGDEARRIAANIATTASFLSDDTMCRERQEADAFATPAGMLESGTLSAASGASCALP